MMDFWCPWRKKLASCKKVLIFLGVTCSLTVVWEVHYYNELVQQREAFIEDLWTDGPPRNRTCYKEVGTTR